MKMYSLDEIIDRDLGVIGTPERDKFENEVENAVKAYHIGEAIKQARKQRKLTQEELGELIGVKKAWVSKVESGKNITLETLIKIARAMNLPINIQLGNLSVTL